MNYSVKLCALVLCAVMLSGAGCATLTQQPIPAGCEASFLYTRTSFLPLGPVVVRSGLFDLAVLVPTTKPLILKACDMAEKAINQGNLAGAIGYFISVLAVQSNDPVILIVVMNARLALETLSLYPGIASAVINDCDRNVLVSLIQNIRRDLQ